MPVTHIQNHLGPHTGPRIYAHNKRGIQMHMQIKRTYNNGSKCTQTHFPHPKEILPSKDHCPSTFPLGKTRPRLALSALSPPWPRTGPALPALACLGGALPALSCQLPAQQRAQCPVLLAAAHAHCRPHPLLLGCHLSIWDPAWAPPSPFLQAVGRVPDPQSWGPAGEAFWQDPRSKGEPIQSLPPPSPGLFFFFRLTPHLTTVGSPQ